MLVTRLESRYSLSLARARIHGPLNLCADRRGRTQAAPAVGQACWAGPEARPVQQGDVLNPGSFLPGARGERTDSGLPSRAAPGFAGSGSPPRDRRRSSRAGPRRGAVMDGVSSELFIPADVYLYSL